MLLLPRGTMGKLLSHQWFPEQGKFGDLWSGRPGPPAGSVCLALSVPMAHSQAGRLGHGVCPWAGLEKPRGEFSSPGPKGQQERRTADQQVALGKWGEEHQGGEGQEWSWPH